MKKIKKIPKIFNSRGQVTPELLVILLVCGVIGGIVVSSLLPVINSSHTGVVESITSLYGSGN